ncbi:MAG: hypothetical protein A2408_02720 [Candidatus Yonathbacteria bacterium RIFOXYC1_FULL_52_10]|uniref:Thioredoxin-like fold domain-containing protein n=1 Tax=Candidatus Yonathbacteria bacterium RIFOXYD1_FULL_52_36 TaxID=1802730 RepID=A0A1G2SLR8_9BACT|nr:MAG: hypothetical protein A2408_02720 [Candidatus Yonathbacteria bacterium RIFOXYC1_FULL_52_10]OHA85894.1 MAG: hypothetical protein A2591_04240 [Candidatus Yonathbacteria bacterium RIFOXYD1_FULL_52_36]
MIDWKKYVIVLIITAVIFFTAIGFNDRVNENRVQEITSIQDKIALDIAASETQFDLLQERSCDAFGESTLSDELGELAGKLAYAEERLGAKDEQVLQLKKYYSLLQVKDFLLIKKMSAKCGFKPITILYFYSNEGDCEKCSTEGYVLTHLRETYPEVRVYSFDYHLSFPVIETLKTMYSLEGELPVLILNEKVTYGFKDENEIIQAMPLLADLKKKRDAEEKARELLDQKPPRGATTTKESR